jgi:hypothetical protein
MVSISRKREDLKAIDPTRDVNYLAERILKEEAVVARSPAADRKPKRGLTPQLVAKLLPKDMREPIHGRKCMRVPMVHLIMRTYVSTYVDNPQRSWEELCRVRRYLMMHTLYNGLGTQQVDLAPVTLATAEAPELMLGLIRRGNDGEFLQKVPKYRSYPVCFLAAEILGFFMHRQCTAYPIVMEKIFRDLPGGPQEVVRMMNTQSWYEAFAAVRMFGFASTHPSACLWFLRHPKALTKILYYSYGAGEIIECHVQKEKMQSVEDYLKVLCNATIRRESYIKTTRIMANYATCMAVLVFNNMMHHFGANHEDFLVLRQVVYDAGIIPHFFTIARHLMRWLTPGRFISGFLQGIYRCLEMERTMKLLFVDNFEFCRKLKMSPGLDSLKYFNHLTLRPSHVTFLLCHALSVKYLIGANWAIAIIAYTLENGSDEVCKPIIETCGYELLDLAHVLTLREPLKISIQNVIMEALLRYAGFSHKVWGKADRYIGEPLPTKSIPEYCLEAALYCRRANLEESLPLAEKQHRVKVADTKKDQGNQCFKKGRYKDAIELYTEALSVCPLAARPKQAVYYRY